MPTSRKRFLQRPQTSWSGQAKKRAGAIPKQQRAFATLKPKNSAETKALRSQKNLLAGYPALELQQHVTETRYAAPNSRQLGASVANADLLTPENQNNLLLAVKYAVGMWKLQAHFQNIVINGLAAIGSPGCLTGPDLTPWIVAAPNVSGANDDFRALINAVASGVSSSFQQWQDFVRVPALPWYPVFAAFPGAMAPPMPNIPMSLIICVSSNQAAIMSSTRLKIAIKAELTDGLKSAQLDQFLDSLSLRLSAYFTGWLASQTVTQVMGMGPVPTYSPPYVPVGPVVGGSIIEAPGHLAS